MCVGITVPMTESFMQPCFVMGAPVAFYPTGMECMAFAETPEVSANGKQSRVHHVDVDDQLLGKTKLCKFFVKGHCSRGKGCTFAHGRKELRPQPNLFKTEMCYEFTNRGWCHRGAECRYAHGQDELRFGQEAQALYVQQQQAAKANGAQQKASKAAKATNSANSSGSLSKSSSFERQTSIGETVEPTFSSTPGSTSPRSSSSMNWEEMMVRQDSFSTDAGAFLLPNLDETEMTEEENEGPMDGAWVVENTFLTLVPANATPTPRRRRAQSSPPTLRRA